MMMMINPRCILKFSDVNVFQIPLHSRVSGCVFNFRLSVFKDMKEMYIEFFQASCVDYNTDIYVNLDDFKRWYNRSQEKMVDQILALEVAGEEGENDVCVEFKVTSVLSETVRFSFLRERAAIDLPIQIINTLLEF